MKTVMFALGHGINTVGSVRRGGGGGCKNNLLSGVNIVFGLSRDGCINFVPKIGM